MVLSSLISVVDPQGLEAVWTGFGFPVRQGVGFIICSRRLSSNWFMIISLSSYPLAIFHPGLGRLGFLILGIMIKSFLNVVPDVWRQPESESLSLWDRFNQLRSKVQSWQSARYVSSAARTKECESELVALLQSVVPQDRQELEKFVSKKRELSLELRHPRTNVGFFFHKIASGRCRGNVITLAMSPLRIMSIMLLLNRRLLRSSKIIFSHLRVRIWWIGEPGFLLSVVGNPLY